MDQKISGERAATAPLHVSPELVRDVSFSATPGMGLRPNGDRHALFRRLGNGPVCPQRRTMRLPQSPPLGEGPGFHPRLDGARARPAISVTTYGWPVRRGRIH